MSDVKVSDSSRASPAGTDSTVNGTVARVTFRNQQTGYSVLRITTEQQGQVVVTGVTNARDGDNVTCEGQWTNHPSFGRQFKATVIAVSLPKDRNGAARYLASGVMPGIGEKLAQRIVDQFGDNVFEVLDSDIDRIAEVPGISKKKLEAIKGGWKKESAVRKIMVFLQGHDVTAALANRIYKTYQEMGLGKSNPDEIIMHIQNHPWNLARYVKGVGFLTADRIALALGKSETDPDRLMAALSYRLEEGAGMGNCGMNTAELILKTAQMLDVDPDLVRRAHTAEATSEKALFIEDGDTTWMAHLYRMEDSIAAALLGMTKGSPSWGAIDAARAVSWVEAETGAELAEQQRSALAMATQNRVTVVTGGPGCGKTFLLKAILKVMERKGVSILQAAPTGRAACRMEESTGMPSSTMHRLLGIGSRQPVEQLNCDLLVLDEASMIDIPLFHQTLRRLPPTASLLIVGDADQLPSVGPGSVLNDLINSGAIPVTRLNKVFRQAEGSNIIRAAHSVNRGHMPDLGDDPASDFLFIEEEDHERIPEIIEELVSKRLPLEYGFDPVNDIQVLCPMKKSPSGTFLMNNRLQMALNPTPAAFHVSFGTRYGIGDKVMQTANDYDRGVFNGDTGVILAVDKEESVLTVRFQSGDVEYGFDDLDALSLASAITTHKSQGSDYPAVVIPVSNQHFIMLQRNLIYTGITRARKLCVLVGQPKALRTAVSNDRAATRATRLGKLLRNGLEDQLDDDLRAVESRHGHFRA